MLSFSDTVGSSDYAQMVGSLSIGKKLPDAVYLHRCALPEINPALRDLALHVAGESGLSTASWDVIKFFKYEYRLSFLTYPAFFDYPYPALEFSVSVDLSCSRVRRIDYRNSSNPPILHRRESFLPPGHASIPVMVSFTSEGEALNLYKDPRRIGYQKNWLDLICSKGLHLNDEGRLCQA
jgi:hypothetical protein